MTTPTTTPTSDAPPPKPPQPSPPRPLGRALLLGALLIPLNVFWVTIIEVRWYTLDGTSLPLFITPVFLLFALVLLNLLWRRRARNAAGPLRQEELLTIYVMLVVSCTFAGHDTGQNLFGAISHPYWYATKDNRWQQLFFQYIPRSLVVTDPDALRGFYRGHVSIYSAQGHGYLLSWVVPLAVWGAFFLTLAGMYLCLTVLLRRPWIDNERLTFPLVQLPLAMTADDAGTALFAQPRLWLGFGLAFAISLVNGLHEIIPTLPQAQIHPFDVQPYFPAPPWNAIGRTTTTFYPFAVGIAYFMPLDLSFSCWFFYLAARLFRVAGRAAGWDSGASHGFPFFSEQTAGAWIGYGAMLLYAGRGYWRAAMQAAWQGRRAADPSEARRLRGALLGLLAGACGLAVFSRLIGLSLWIGVGFWSLVLLLGVVITRIRAELGAPHEMTWGNPSDALVALFGTSALGPHTLTALSLVHWFNRGCRNHPMPNQLEAFKMLEGRPGVRFGGIVGTLALAMGVSLLSAYWANLHVTYDAGASAKAAGFKWWVGSESFGGLASWLTQPQPPSPIGRGFMAGGFAFVVLLSVLRTRFAGWPLHPAGYLLGISYAMEYFWLPVLIAWLLKAVLLRYGGSHAYRTAVPFFLGLILGDYTMGALWAIAGPLLGIPTYKIYI